MLPPYPVIAKANTIANTALFNRHMITNWGGHSPNKKPMRFLQLNEEQAFAVKFAFPSEDLLPRRRDALFDQIEIIKNGFILVAYKLKMHGSMIEHCHSSVAIFFQPLYRPILVHEYLLVEESSCSSNHHVCCSIFSALISVQFAGPFIAMVMRPKSQVHFVIIQQVFKQPLHVCSHNVVIYME